MAKIENKIRDIYSTYIRPSEGAGTTTLTSTDRRSQVFNLSAARTVVLPTTGIKAGDIITLENIGAFDLTVQSSNATALTVANGTNMDATIRKGKVVLIALQDAPTTPSHWKVRDVYEEVSYSDTTTGAISTTATVTLRRVNNIIHVKGHTTSATAGAAGDITVPGTNMPSRYRPANNYAGFPTAVISNSVNMPSMAYRNSLFSILSNSIMILAIFFCRALL